MKRLVHTLVTAILTVTAVALPVSAKEKGKDKDCWVLSQLNPNSPYSHSQLVLISQEGVQISASDVKFFMQAPKYDIAIYNTTSRTYYAAPLKEWLSKYGANPFSKSGKYMLKMGSGKVAGLNCDQYFMMHGKGKQAKKLREVWTTSVFGTDRHVAEILQHLCGMPEGSVDGIPLRIIRVVDGGRQEMFVNTLSVKHIATPKNVFKQPTGYTKVKSQLELMINYGKDSELKDLLEGTTDSRK